MIGPSLLRAIVHVATCVLAATAAAQQSVDFEQILLPVTVRDVPGASGSIWSTELAVSIDVGGGRPAIVPLLAPSACDPPCSEPIIVPDDGHMLFIDFYRTHMGETAGSYVYVERNLNRAAHFSLTVRDRAALLSTELPVVHEQDFVGGVVEILDVPTSQAARVMLRVYGGNPSDVRPVEVRVFDDSVTPADILFNDQVSLAVQQLEIATPFGPLPLRPPVLEMSLDRFDAAGRRLRIRITPGGDARVWAFVTITENDTQHVVLRTPR